MKKIYTTLFLLAITFMSFSQTYYVYTANQNGLWSQSGNWDSQLRTDGTNKNKYVIPEDKSIIIDNSVDGIALGDIEIFVAGNIDLTASFDLSNNSRIQLNNGTISGDANNIKIKIASVIKYKVNVDGVETGLSFADNTTGTSPDGFSAFSILPVNFTSFYISKSGQNIQLTWSTDKEIDNSHFDVERSFNGTLWERISTMLSAGIGNNTNNYTYNDKNISNPVVYYRLRQVDLNGRSVYSSIKMIRMSETIAPIKIYGFDKNVVIDFNTAVKSKVTVSVINNSGQIISQKSYTNPSYKINLNCSNIANGAYIIQVSDNKGWSEVKKLIL